MLQADSNAPKLIQVRAPDAVIAKRHEAARKAGVPITDALSFDWVPEAAPASAQEPAQVRGGIYRAAETRPINDAEMAIIAPLLPDAPGAKVSNRAMIDAALRFVIQGDSWTTLGHGRRWPAVREKIRREREYRRDRWTLVLQASDAFDDMTMRVHFQRVARWIRDGDMRELAAIGHRRIRSKAALAEENAKRRATIEANSFGGDVSLQNNGAERSHAPASAGR